ncbi:MAG: Clp protease ClpP [Flavobacteriales bacterium]|nr:Clp protease ClpP [Flavobacteriales bacterium]
MKSTALQIFNYSLVNQGNNVVDIHIDGDIVDSPTQEIYRNFWGDETSVSFRSFRNQIESAKASEINLYINSTGGHVGDAMAMYDYLKELENKGTKVNRIGRGIIASAATYLLLGNNSTMTENSMLMIHNVQMYVAGDIVQCENQVKAGRKFNDNIKQLYVNNTGKPAETIAAWMNKETWFTAQEAKDNGFVQNISGSVNFTNQIKPELWPYQNEAILNKYNSFTIKNNSEMDVKAITDAIENGFKKFFANQKDVKLPDNAAKDFATEIVNALKDAIPNDDKIKEIANQAVSEATADDVKVLEETFVNKKAMEDFKNEVIKTIGNKSNGTEVKSTTSSNPKNRFAGRTFFNEDK